MNPCVNCGRQTTGSTTAYMGGHGYVAVGLCRTGEGCTAEYAAWLASRHLAAVAQVGRAGGLTLAAQRGSAYFSEIRQSRPCAALAVYADNPAGWKLRAQDIRAKRTMTTAAWARLMRQRERSFGLPTGSLK